MNILLVVCVITFPIRATAPNAENITWNEWATCRMRP